MKNPISGLRKEFENRVRLGIMSALMVNEWMEFTDLKHLLQITDGNLASHAAALEKAGLIEVRKRFVGKKPNTSYRATSEGKKAFKQHLDALEKLLKNNR